MLNFLLKQRHLHNKLLQVKWKEKLSLVALGDVKFDGVMSAMACDDIYS